MASKGVMIHYNFHRMEALEQALKERGIELEDALVPALKQLYEMYVPATVRGQVELKVSMDEAQDMGEQQTFTLLCCWKNGNCHNLIVSSPMMDGFYKAAGMIYDYYDHSYGADISKFSGMQQLDGDTAMELIASVPHNRLIAQVIDWDMDNGIVERLDGRTGIQLTYPESKVLDARVSVKASDCADISQLADRFYEGLNGMEIKMNEDDISLEDVCEQQMGGM